MNEIPNEVVLRKAIEYALETEDGLEWLRAWNDGDNQAMDDLGERYGWFHVSAGVYEEMTDEQ